MVDYSKIHFWSYVLDSGGEPIEDAEVRLYLNDDPTTEARIYGSESSSTYTTTSDADIKTDGDGYFEFWIGDSSDNDDGYDHDQLFRLEWYKAGTAPGIIENVNPWPNAFGWEDTNSGGDKNYKNKFVSDYLVNQWLSHLSEVVPSASPHDLYKVDFESGCSSNRYNKLVSNKLLNDIVTLSNLASAESLGATRILENQQDLTSWTSSSGIYYADISHPLITVKEVSVQVGRLDNDVEFTLKRIINSGSGTTRLFSESETDLRVNVQGYSSSSSSSTSSSSSSTSSSSTSSSSTSSSSSSSSSTALPV